MNFASPCVMLKSIFLFPQKTKGKEKESLILEGKRGSLLVILNLPSDGLNEENKLQKKNNNNKAFVSNWSTISN